MTNPTHAPQNVLDVVTALGFTVVGDGRSIQPGDLYLTDGNLGVSIFTCKLVNKYDGWICPTDPTGYPFDISKCYKVIEHSQEGSND